MLVHACYNYSHLLKEQQSERLRVYIYLPCWELALLCIETTSFVHFITDVHLISPEMELPSRLTCSAEQHCQNAGKKIQLLQVVLVESGQNAEECRVLEIIAIGAA
jgi:hypothetical protein